MTQVLIDTQAAQPHVIRHHDELTHGMRWGTISSSGAVNPGASGCFAGAASSVRYAADENLPAIYACYHGDGTELTISELTDPEKYNAKMASNTRPWNKFEGTERSEIWVSYLMGDTSPWKALHPFILEKDTGFINNAGFIFAVDGLPKKLWYNFLMAIRYPWEQSAAYSTFLLLLDYGMESNIACFISNSFFLKAGAKDITGPWEIQYPMSYLEQMTLEAAGRFINQKPGDLSGDAKTAVSPNCAVLWQTSNAQAKVTACARAEKISENPELSLDQVLEAVTLSVSEQQD